MKTKRLYIVWTLLLGLIAPVLLFQISKVYIANWHGINIPVHSVFETLGLFASILLAIILLQKIDEHKNTIFYILISSGLLALGILDGFHALTGPGNLFVWLHSIAVLLGGFLFALILFPFKDKPIQKIWRIPAFVAIVSIVIGIFSMVFSDSLPLMTKDGVFTQTSNVINIIGGVLFLLASVGLIIRIWDKKDTLVILLTVFSLLLGVSGLIFPLGQIWTFEWWMWHILRLLAYFILLGYVMYIFSETIRNTFVLSGNLKQRNTDMSDMLSEIKETVNILASSSLQILTATSQMASGVSETASAISQTTTTVEEVQQAAKLSAEKAKNVAENSQRVVQVSAEGQNAVEKNISGMDNIQNQMKSIAITINKLKEHGLAIGDIISTVKEVANQSNILAINAAIEAAKAGEHGKGFSEVALQIKKLAQQSKQSTEKVRKILDDVQKVIKAAVANTEQGNSAVETGVKQSNITSDSIRFLSQTVNESVLAATQIEASSYQQLEGIEQVGTAMISINDAGKENANSMIQAEKAAKELNELGQKLKMLVEQYEIIKK